MRLSPRTVNGTDSPMGAADALLAGRSGERALLDLAQAAPGYPPAAEMIEHVGLAGLADFAERLALMAEDQA